MSGSVDSRKRYAYLPVTYVFTDTGDCDSDAVWLVGNTDITHFRAYFSISGYAVVACERAAF